MHNGTRRRSRFRFQEVLEAGSTDLFLRRCGDSEAMCAPSRSALAEMLSVGSWLTSFLHALHAVES